MEIVIYKKSSNYSIIKVCQGFGCAWVEHLYNMKEAQNQSSEKREVGVEGENKNKISWISLWST